MVIHPIALLQARLNNSLTGFAIEQANTCASTRPVGACLASLLSLDLWRRSVLTAAQVSASGADDAARFRRVMI